MSQRALAYSDRPEVVEALRGPFIVDPEVGDDETTARRRVSAAVVELRRRAAEVTGHANAQPTEAGVIVMMDGSTVTEDGTWIPGLGAQLIAKAALADAGVPGEGFDGPAADAIAEILEPIQ